MYRMFPAVTATKTQTAAYLLGVALFSISFLVFLNASISFVVTDVIGRKTNVGDAVGTLGFADELLALVACPLWGLLSDRIGVKNVAVMGYCIIAVSFIVLVQSSNVYPQLLLGRLAFSIGGAACSTMVTAILPALTMDRRQSLPRDDAPIGTRPPPSPDTRSHVRHSGAFSISSQLTITPARYGSRRGAPPDNTPDQLDATLVHEDKRDTREGVSSQLAGYVGMFTGIGALLAVGIFLPLPAALAGSDTSKKEAVKDSFYIVACVAFVVALLVFFGLRGLPGDEDKGFRNFFSTTVASDQKHDDSTTSTPPVGPTYFQLVRTAVVLAFTDSRISLGYLGGFVARASSVAISLFIPLFVNAYFIRHGLCTEEPGEDIKSKCKRAYTLASMLSGFAELAALLCAPLFGWFNSRMSGRGVLSNLPLGIGAVTGIVGCIGFGMVKNPDPFSKEEHGNLVILAVILLGISQIAAIVCSLGSLAKGIQSAAQSSRPDDSESLANVEETISDVAGPFEAAETAPLIAPPRVATSQTPPASDRTQLKGTIAGIYSLVGGVGILILTKLGGVLFDRTSTGAPFYLLAGSNGLLLIAVIVVAIHQRVRDSHHTAS